MNLKTCRNHLLIATDKCIQIGYWLQIIGFFIIAVALLWNVLQLEITGLHSLGHVAVVKIVIYLLALACVLVVNYAPVFWFYMIGAAPKAMLEFGFVKILVRYLLTLVTRLQTAKIQLHLWLIHKRPFHSGHYSLASLFSLSVVPYHLYSLSCCQLE